MRGNSWFCHRGDTFLAAMDLLRIQTLGELAVFAGDRRCVLPASKKTRALLAYLALTGRPQRRDRLCELFWSTPDDPRAALRWSLSKLRPSVNDSANERLVADRERVAFDDKNVEIDVRRVEAWLDDPEVTVDVLRQVSSALDEPFLEGVDPAGPGAVPALAGQRTGFGRPPASSSGSRVGVTSSAASRGVTGHGSPMV